MIDLIYQTFQRYTLDTEIQIDKKLRTPLAFGKGLRKSIENKMKSKQIESENMDDDNNININANSLSETKRVKTKNHCD